jgi:16S rRNA (guanine527-N7)-methyltransferase
MSWTASFRDLLAPHATGRELDRLVRYADLLSVWSERHNLVRFVGPQELVDRHLLDSLAAAPFLGARGRLLDVGSGAGLPGVPLLVVRPEWSGVLLEPRQKRWAFLKMVVRELGLKADVERARFQEWRVSGSFDAITMRAVGGLEDVVSWSLPHLRESAQVLLWTTTDRLDGLRALAGWRVLSSQLPGLDCGRLARLQPCFT